MNRLGRIALAALAATAFGGADAADKAVSPADFVRRAALSDMFETKTSELAAIKGDGPARAFAAQMNAAHQKTSSELGVIVKGHASDLPLPPRLDPADQRRVDRLEELDGAAFVQQYRSDQLAAHRKAIALFEGFVADGRDARLKEWAAKTLPKLKQHLSLAETLAAR